ncbi:hypothetical protein KO481_41630 [Nocardia sp. NEAU-G5]|uniref:Excreted virulence factor EspC (Type VII ESX diderm) n=1 Tax=Nocardia albiluteola TaxID=2842303 RepID=A0ABS6BCZ5_9NOCA|nr:hypothetical protein [Nocardia albiluteola]MBU3068003.1 hypothetical protein [Nocardia albiluteola]
MSDFTNLTKAAQGNYIRLDPQAAQDCASLCHDLIKELTNTINDIPNLDNVQGFGLGVQNAIDLANAYNALTTEAKGGDSSLEHALKKHRDVVTDMLDTFAAAGRAYKTNEHDSAAELSKYDKMMDGYKSQS